MVLVTHQLQGSYVPFSSRPLLWRKESALKHRVTALSFVRRTERCISLKQNTCSSVGAFRPCGLKVKHLKVVAFKGSARNAESGSRVNGSNVPENPVKLSFARKESEDTLVESPKPQNGSLSYAPGTDERITGSPAIQKLFRKWLTMLSSPLTNQMADGVLVEGQSSSDPSKNQMETQSSRGGILKALCCHFWNLDATIKAPLLIFIPWYLAINAIYGAEVSKELTPLWVIGPLIIALYIKMLRGLCALYVFCFKQTVHLVRNLPTYYLVAYKYVKEGKLREGVRSRVWQPVEDIKNLDYKELSIKMMKGFQEWMIEKYLDFVESIWPYYCRTIRFLKRANLI